MTSTKPKAPRPAKPKRNLGKVFASVRQVVRVEHVAERDAVWTWGTPGKSFLGNNIRIAVWNLWKGAGGQAFAREFVAISEQADLVLTQEALLSQEMIRLFAQPGLEAVHAATYRRVDGCRDGVMTLGRASLALPPERVISATAEPFLKTTKAALLTYYRIGSATGPLLAVANIHSTLIRRPRTAGLEIKRVIEKLEEHEGPVLFAGDFNTFSKAYFRTMEAALNILNIVHAPLLQDPRTNLGQLDQLFVRGLNIDAIAIDLSFKHSDHFPIICQCSLE